MESTTELESLRARALSGDSQAQYEFGKLLRERTSDDARDDQAQGEGWLRRASENGHVLASYELACILAALRDDFINAIPLWRVAAKGWLSEISPTLCMVFCTIPIGRRAIQNTKATRRKSWRSTWTVFGKTRWRLFMESDGPTAKLSKDGSFFVLAWKAVWPPLE